MKSHKNIIVLSLMTLLMLSGCTTAMNNNNNDGNGGANTSESLQDTSVPAYPYTAPIVRRIDLPNYYDIPIDRHRVEGKTRFIGELIEPEFPVNNNKRRCVYDDFFELYISVDNPDQLDFKSVLINDTVYTRESFTDVSISSLTVKIPNTLTTEYEPFTVKAFELKRYGESIGKCSLKDPKTIYLARRNRTKPEFKNIDLVYDNDNAAATYSYTLEDPMSFVDLDYSYICISDGEKIIAKEKIKPGSNSVTFNNLKRNYSYEIAGLLIQDIRDGNGYNALFVGDWDFIFNRYKHSIEIEPHDFYANIKVVFEDPSAQLTELSLFDDNRDLIKQLPLDTTRVDNLAPEETYYITYKFTYKVGSTVMHYEMEHNQFRTTAIEPPIITYSNCSLTSLYDEEITTYSDLLLTFDYELDKESTIKSINVGDYLYEMNEKYLKGNTISVPVSSIDFGEERIGKIGVWINSVVVEYLGKNYNIDGKHYVGDVTAAATVTPTSLQVLRFDNNSLEYVPEFKVTDKNIKYLKIGLYINEFRKLEIVNSNLGKPVFDPESYAYLFPFDATNLVSNSMFKFELNWFDFKFGDKIIHRECTDIRAQGYYYTPLKTHRFEDWDDCINNLSSDANYLLTTDIDMHNISIDRAVFKDVIKNIHMDGQLHAIKNITFKAKSPLDSISFFDTLENSYIKNVRFENVKVNIDGKIFNPTNIALFAAHVKNSVIENVTFNETNSLTVTGDTTMMSDKYVGGMIAQADNCVIKECDVNMNVIAPYRSVGGIVALARDCYFYDSDNEHISWSTANTKTVGGDYTGGIIGRAFNTCIYYCYNNFLVEGHGNYTGGIVGQTDCSIRSCAIGHGPSGVNYVGGIAGSFTSGWMLDCNVSDSTISGTSSVGALAGENGGYIFSCNVEGSKIDGRGKAGIAVGSRLPGGYEQHNYEGHEIGSLPY